MRSSSQRSIIALAVAKKHLLPCYGVDETEFVHPGQSYAFLSFWPNRVFEPKMNPEIIDVAFSTKDDSHVQKSFFTCREKNVAFSLDKQSRCNIIGYQISRFTKERKTRPWHFEEYQDRN